MASAPNAKPAEPTLAQIPASGLPNGVYSAIGASTLSANGDGDVSPISFHALVVEDNIINQTVLRRQLLKAGWKCDGMSIPWSMTFADD